MQLHVTSSFFTSSPQNCTGAFNAAEEAKLCSRPENYGRNPDPSRARCIAQCLKGSFCAFDFVPHSYGRRPVLRSPPCLSPGAAARKSLSASAPAQAPARSADPRGAWGRGGCGCFGFGGGGGGPGSAYLSGQWRSRNGTNGSETPTRSEPVRVSRVSVRTMTSSPMGAETTPRAAAGQRRKLAERACRRRQCVVSGWRGAPGAAAGKNALAGEGRKHFFSSQGSALPVEYHN
jgi:hypothetical protein